MNEDSKLVIQDSNSHNSELIDELCSQNLTLERKSDKTICFITNGEENTNFEKISSSENMDLSHDGNIGSTENTHLSNNLFNAIREVKEISNNENINDEDYNKSSDDDDVESSGSSYVPCDYNNVHHGSSDEDEKVKMYVPRTKGEFTLSDLPPIEDLTLEVPNDVQLIKLGSIKSIIDVLVVVQSEGEVPALDIETILFLEGRIPLGQIFETFGPVKSPWYSIRFNSLAEIGNNKLIKTNEAIYFAPQMSNWTKYVFLEELRRMRGSDASWKNNNEPPEGIVDFSDDEQERIKKKAKSLKRNQSSEIPLKQNYPTSWPPDSKEETVSSVEKSWRFRKPRHRHQLDSVSHESNRNYLHRNPFENKLKSSQLESYNNGNFSQDAPHNTLSSNGYDSLVCGAEKKPADKPGNPFLKMHHSDLNKHNKADNKFIKNDAIFKPCSSMHNTSISNNFNFHDSNRMNYFNTNNFNNITSCNNNYNYNNITTSNSNPYNFNNIITSNTNNNNFNNVTSSYTNRLNNFDLSGKNNLLFVQNYSHGHNSNFPQSVNNNLSMSPMVDCNYPQLNNYPQNNNYTQNNNYPQNNYLLNSYQQNCNQRYGSPINQVFGGPHLLYPNFVRPPIFGRLPNFNEGGVFVDLTRPPPPVPK